MCIRDRHWETCTPRTTLTTVRDVRRSLINTYCLLMVPIISVFYCGVFIVHNLKIPYICLLYTSRVSIEQSSYIDNKVILLPIKLLALWHVAPSSWNYISINSGHKQII